MKNNPDTLGVLAIWMRTYESLFRFLPHPHTLCPTLARVWRASIRQSGFAEAFLNLVHIFLVSKREKLLNVGSPKI